MLKLNNENAIDYVNLQPARLPRNTGIWSHFAFFSIIMLYKFYVDHKINQMIALLMLLFFIIAIILTIKDKQFQGEFYFFMGLIDTATSMLFILLLNNMLNIEMGRGLVLVLACYIVTIVINTMWIIKKINTGEYKEKKNQNSLLFAFLFSIMTMLVARSIRSSIAEDVRNLFLTFIFIFLFIETASVGWQFIMRSIFHKKYYEVKM